ncbi:hypothetical protein GCM10028817_18540 [Spirosoma pomorum]
MAIDAQNRFHVVFRGSRGDGLTSTRGVWYGLSTNGTSWTFTEIQTFSDPSGFKNTNDPVIEVDAQNNPHIGFLTSDANDPRTYSIRYYRYTGATWVGETAFTQSGGSPASNEINNFDMAIDGAGKAHLAIQRETNGQGRNGGLVYTTNSSGSWVAPTVIAEGAQDQTQGTTLGIDTDAGNKVHIVFSGYPGQIKYTNNASGSFATPQQINGNLAGSIIDGSFRINSNGSKSFGYNSSGLQFAYQPGGSGNWLTASAFAPQTGVSFGSFPSAILSPGGRIMVLFDYLSTASGNCGTSNTRRLWYATATVPTTAAVPTVITSSASAITTTSASLGGNVTADGGATVTGRGVVYSSTNTNPTIGGSGVTQAVNGSGTGTFSATITGLSPGTTYYVRAYATNSAGTSYGSPVVTFTTSAPTITIAPTTLPGGTVGLAYAQTFTASGGTAPYTYAVTAGALPAGMTLTSSGTLSGTPTAGGTFNFTVRAIDVGGFISTRAYSLAIAAPTITVSPASLPNGTAGTAYSLNITASGGTSPYTYAVTAGALPAGMTLAANGVLSGTPTVSGTFTFTVRAQDSSTGSGPYSATRVYTLTIAAPTITLTPASLPNGAVGSAYTQTLTASGGTSPYTYAVTAGALPTGMTLASNGTLSGTPTGGSGIFNFTIQATDAQNFSGTRTYALTITAPTISGLGASPATVCLGSPITVTASIGQVSAAYNYTLTVGNTVLSGVSSGPFSQTVNANGSGSANINLVVSQNGRASADASVTVNAPPVAGLLNNGPLICGGSSVTLTASGGVSYQFSTGATQVGSAPTATVTSAGVYSVTVIGTNGCTATASTQVTGDQSVPVAGLTNDGPLSCTKTSVTLTASGSGTYQFSTGATPVNGGPTATVTTAGVYSVTVVGANGCSSIASTTVVGDQSLPVAGLTNDGPLSCTKTSVTLTATGNGTYRFSAGATPVNGGPTATVTSAGVYSVTVVGSNGCSSIASTTVVGDQSVPVAGLTNDGPLSCAKTSVTLTASGVGTYQFSSGATPVNGGPTATVTTAGVYSVTVVGANGCSSIASTTVVGDQSVPVAGLTNDGPLSCTKTSVTLTASGVGAYQFSAGATPVNGGPTATVTSAGVYSVTVIGSNGCSSVASTTVVGDQSVPVAGLTNDGPLSCTKTSVLLTASGAGTYQFSAGATPINGGPTATVTTAGIYSVTVVGSNGCSSIASTTVVGDQSVPVAGLTNDGPLSCTKTSVTLTASGVGTYQFSSGATPINGGPTASVSTAGVYSVTVVGANGCSSIASTTVVGDQSVPVAGLTNDGPLSCNKTTALLTASGTGTYQFSGGATPINGGPTASVSTAGVYSVTVVGANGCSSVASTTVVGDQSLPMAGLTNDGPLSCTKTSVTLTASGVGTYQFSQGATPMGSGPTASVSTAGVYSVTVVGANGCSSIASTTVVGDQSVPTVSLTSSGPLACSGGTTTLIASSTTPGATYRFSQGAIQVNGGNTATVTTAGVYSVTATAVNGCFAVASITVTAAACNFAISGVTTVSCVVVDAARGQRQVTFVPQYSGLNGQPVTFSITNELAATTAAGPYTLRLYSDNPVITLVAQQGGVSSTFSYNWLSACGGSVEPPTNTPPTVVGVIPAQTASVGQPFSYVIPAGTFSDAQTPTQLVLSVAGLPAGLVFTAPATISGVATATGVSTVQVTATDPGGLSASTSFQLTVTGGTVSPPAGFAISGVTTVSCVVVDAARGQRQITFVPQYTGLNGQPVTFSVPNELAATTAAGPYTLRLYSDNPVITLVAQQGGVSSTFSYNWLSACGGSVEPPTNTPPTVVGVIPAQTASVGQPFSYVIPAGTFSDAQTPTQLTLSVAGLPAGLVFTAPATISGVATATGVSTVQVTATDPGGLSASTSFQLTVTGGTVSPPAGFAISGVTTVSCVVVDAARGQRQVTFVPQYTGLSGQPVTFSVTNELAATTAPGPYTLRLYSDNPMITLVAQQGGVSNTFSYNWLSACGSSQGRVGVLAESTMQVRVLGNPVEGDELMVEVRGAQGQPLTARVLDERGYPAAEPLLRPSAEAVERLAFRLPGAGGVYVLQVSIPGQQQSLKVIKR